MIIINSNEAMNKKLIAAFKRHGIPYIIKPIKEGDFSNVKGTFVAERKSIMDFWGSMNDGRIDAQVIEMYAAYKKNRYVFVEAGAFQHLSIVKKQRNRVYSKYGHIENWKVQVREYIDFDDLVLKLNSLDIYLKTPRVVRERRKTIRGVPENVKLLMGLAGIGEKTAKKMLGELKTAMNVIKDIVENDGEQLGKIHGVKKGGKIITKAKTVLTQK